MQNVTFTLSLHFGVHFSSWDRCKLTHLNWMVCLKNCRSPSRHSSFSFYILIFVKNRQYIFFRERYIILYSFLGKNIGQSENHLLRLITIYRINYIRENRNVALKLRSIWRNPLNYIHWEKISWYNILT